MSNPFCYIVYPKKQKVNERGDKMESFSAYCERTRAEFELEWAIIKDKLAQGINGIEWILLNGSPKDVRLQTITGWIDQLKMEGYTDLDSVMKDALTMDADNFYDKYEYNWWLSVSYTLTYLYLLKERDYEKYFNFLQWMDKKGADNE